MKSSAAERPNGEQQSSGLIQGLSTAPVDNTAAMYRPTITPSLAAAALCFSSAVSAQLPEGFLDALQSSAWALAECEVSVIRSTPPSARLSCFGHQEFGDELADGLMALGADELEATSFRVQAGGPAPSGSRVIHRVVVLGSKRPQALPQPDQEVLRGYSTEGLGGMAAMLEEYRSRRSIADAQKKQAPAAVAQGTHRPVARASPQRQAPREDFNADGFVVELGHARMRERLMEEGFDFQVIRRTAKSTAGEVVVEYAGPFPSAVSAQNFAREAEPVIHRQLRVTPASVLARR